jgi:hypothetical protein
VEEIYNKDGRYVKRVGVLSWAVKREGNPLMEVRGFEGFDRPKPYKVLSKHLPVPSFLETAQELHKMGELSDRDLMYLSSQLKRMAIEKGGETKNDT